MTAFVTRHRTTYARPVGRTTATLLAGTSALALMLGMSSAHAISVGSRSSATTSATTIASDAARAMAQQAQETAQRVQQSLSRATQALRSMQDIQAAARAAAQAQQASRTVTDGLSAGGLIVDPRVAAGNSSNLWVNAKLPTQTTSNGQTTVTVQQTAQRAIATWQQFNVGRNTTLYFDQSGGNSANGNSWTILNRIDATGSPSQILGQIRAEGTVLIINPNGIIFNGTSQINVHTLIASAMDMNSFTGTANGAFKASGDAYVPISVSGLTQTTPNGTLILAPSDEANANTVFLNNGLFVNTRSCCYNEQHLTLAIRRCSRPGSFPRRTISVSGSMRAPASAPTSAALIMAALLRCWGRRWRTPARSSPRRARLSWRRGRACKLQRRRRTRRQTEYVTWASSRHWRNAALYAAVGERWVAHPQRRGRGAGLPARQYHTDR